MKRINIKLNSKILYIILGIIVLSIFTLTLAYAVLSVTLNIQGNANIAASTWNIYLDNIKVKKGSVEANTPIISGTTLTFSSSLTTPGDFYEFSVDVINGGTIDALINGITKTPELTTEQQKYLRYIVEYENGENINSKQLVAKNSFVRLKVRVEFRKDISASDLPSAAQTLSSSFSVNYIQSDGSGEEVFENGIYDPYKIGNEHCFDTECFYVISSTEEDVTMLAKYSLYVGGVYENNRWTAYGDEATGKQDKNMIVDENVEPPYPGTSSFANTDYWKETTSSYPAYVYNSNSNLYPYIENYKTYLSSLGISIIEARLIKYEEVEKLSSSDLTDISWLYETTYWTGSADNTSIYIVIANNGLGWNYFLANRYGVRPVITISKSYFN